jgi:hypothetical protein
MTQMHGDKLARSAIRITAVVIFAVMIGTCFETGYDGKAFDPDQRPGYAVQQAKAGQEARRRDNESVNLMEHEYEAEVRHVANLFSCPRLDSAQTDSLFVLATGDEANYLPSRLAADVWKVCKYSLPARRQP